MEPRRRFSFSTTIELSGEQLEAMNYVTKQVDRFMRNESERPELYDAFMGVLKRGRALEKGFIRDAAVKRASNGRRLIGATTRAKVAKEADILRHKMTKGDAAYAIAEIVKKDSGTVKRYLTELFPGDKWKTTNQ